MLLKAKDVADRMQVSIQTVWRLVDAGTLPAIELTQSAQELAEAHCQEQGLHAKVNQRDQDYARIVYDCVP